MRSAYFESGAAAVAVATLNTELLSWAWQQPATFHDPTTLPVGPSDGDRYIATATANGWTDEYVYEWDIITLAWLEAIPVEGWVIWTDSDLWYWFNGTNWIQIGQRISQLPNDTFSQGRNFADDAWIDMWKVNVSDYIEPGANVSLQGIELADDFGDRTLVDGEVTATPTVGDSMSYLFSLDHLPYLRVAAEADGAGGTQRRHMGMYCPMAQSRSEDMIVVAATGITQGMLDSGSITMLSGTADVTITATPAIVTDSVPNGWIAHFEGASSSFGVTFQSTGSYTDDGGALYLNGDADFTLSWRDKLVVQYHSSSVGQYWAELFRSNN